MKKGIFTLLIAGLTLSACLPGFLQPGGAAGPTPDTQATIAAGLTSQAETLQPQASPTLVPSSTRTPTATRTATHTAVPVTDTAAISETVFSTPATGTQATATNITGTPGTPIFPTLESGSATTTLHPRFYGTQPPAIEFGRLKLINKSKSEAYISIQCVTKDGQVSIIEYPVPRRLEVRAPAGRCIYVAWVGGRKMTGQFTLGASGEKTITLYKDRIGIK